MTEKRIKCEVIKVFDFSELPNELIANIVSRLTLKQAASTSVVSPGWKHLWKLYSGCFDFDGYETFVPGDRLPPTRTLLTERSMFVDWVNHVFQSHQGTTIQGLRIIFNLKKASYAEIDKWIQLALVKSVKFIELDLSGFEFSDAYDFPVHTHCGFQSLTTLYLTRVNISGNALETLLDNSPNLEELSITYSVSLEEFNVSSLSLKYLTLWACGRKHYYRPVCMKISATELLSFTWQPTTWSELVFNDATNLEFVELSRSLPVGKHYAQIKELVLSFFTGCHCVDNNGMDIPVPELSNLRRLTMTQDSLDDHTFSHFVGFLNAAPLLEKFTIKLRGILTDAKFTQDCSTRRENHCYKNLKEVKFIGFGKGKDAKFIEFLLNHAPLLDKITVDVCRPQYWRTSQEIEHRQTKTYLVTRSRAISFCASLSRRVTVV
ncbi:hypothetical protein ACFE04_000212 [Oxalis oulophora]